jgi:hypothetical protein
VLLVCHSTAFCLTLKLFLVTPVFSRYFGKVLVTIPSAEVTKGYTNTLSFHVVLNPRVKFSYFAVFYASVLGSDINYKCCFILSTSTVSGLLKFTVLSVMIDLFQHKIMLADSSTGSGFYL